MLPVALFAGSLLANEAPLMDALLIASALAMGGLLVASTFTLAKSGRSVFDLIARTTVLRTSRED